MLEVRGLTRRFGGLLANDGIDLVAPRGEIHVVIGPNGAGKSTLINLLSGELAPSSGTVALQGRDITALAAWQRARLGVGRSYQKTNIFGELSVYENCRLAAQARHPQPWRLFGQADDDTDTMQAAERALEQAELSHRRHRRASALSHGEQRQLEIALCLATAPSVLLLDEPLAGMGVEESQRMSALIGRLRPDHAIVLVEHDLDAVFALADTLTVLVEGRVLATGSSEVIRANPDVQRAYLGTEQFDA